MNLIDNKKYSNKRTLDKILRINLSHDSIINNNFNSLNTLSRNDSL